MKNLIYSLVLLLFASHQLDAQSLIGNNLYNFNPFALHPAYAGHTGNLETVLQAKTKEMRVGENYIGSLLTINGKVNENVGLGAKIVTNQQGIFENLGLSASSSYTTQLQENHRLSFGISLGITRFSMNTNSLAINQFADETDPFLTNGAINQTVINISAGLVYRWKELEFAFTSPSLFQDNDGIRELITSTIQYKFKRENIAVIPSVLFRLYEVNPSEFTGNVRIEWKETIWTQLGYRNNETLLFGAGLHLNEITMGYAYGVAFGDYNNLTTGGHEIVLGINFGDTKIKE